MVQKPEDIWRRRTALALLRTKEELAQNPLIQRINSLI
jgi:glycerol-3-phosphate dehydrogenase